VKIKVLHCLAMLACVSLSFTVSSGETITVSPSNSVILAPSEPTRPQLEAAEELAKHLGLITGVAITAATGPAAPEGKYPFCVGIPPRDDAKPFAPEEARWLVTPAAAFFYGAGSRSDRGALFAVYAFLEDQLGVRWTEPGDQGIAFVEQSPLVLTPGASSWAPQLEKRSIRVGRRVKRYGGLSDRLAEFSDFLISHEEHDRIARDQLTWRNRMRMGGHSTVDYGHVFTGWWDKYAESHPEYFGLNKWGRREPEKRKRPTTAEVEFTEKDRESVKVCASNPGVVAQIVRQWLDRGRRTKWVNACMNDQVWGFCRCPSCLKLDGRKEGEELGQYLTGLTDRYVYLTNQVAREARKHDPEAGAVMYAYETSELPPRREKVDPNVAVVIVPTTVDVPELHELYVAWRKVGAGVMLLRPNYHCYYNTLPLPMGFEKQMFEAFQVAVEYGMTGTDYDHLIGLWPVHGLSDYVLVRAFSDPSKPFEHWEDHYCFAYGPAAAYVKAYFRYWREEFWEKRIKPELGKIVVKGKCHNFARGVYWSLDEHYRAEDFDLSDAILEQAAARDLSNSQKDKLQQLVLANRHARLILEAANAKRLSQFQASQALLAFRTQHKSDLRLPWLTVFSTETRFGDRTGMTIARRLKAYPLPWRQTGLAWRFKLDPADIGLQEKWQELNWQQTGDWGRLRTDFYWDNPYRSETDPALYEKVKGYDGIGWYSSRQIIAEEMRGRQLFLHFGAVDDSCWVYVNGKLAGRHLCEKPEDRNAPFEIRIDPYVDGTGFQIFTVRVEDKGGPGGIWKRVWLVSKSADE